MEDFTSIRYSPLTIRSFNNYEWLAEFDRLAVLDENLRYRAGAWRRDLVHRLHRFDDQQGLPGRYLAADLDERFGAGLGRPIGGTDHRRGDRARMLGRIGTCRRAAS